MWSLTANWGAFGGMLTKDWKKRDRSTEEMYGAVYGAVSQIPGVRVFPRLDPPLPTPGQYDVELVLAERRAARADAGDGRRRRRRRLPERQVPLRRHRPQDRPARSARRDRPREGRRPRARPGERRPELGTLLGGGYVNRFNYFERSYKVIPQIGDENRATVASAARPQDQDAERRARARLHLHAHRVEQRAAHAQPIPAAERRARVRRREAGRHEGRRAARARGRGAGGGRDRRDHRLRRRVAADPPRGRGAHRHARLRRRAHLPGARGAVPELPRSADRAPRLGAAGHLRRADLQLPRPDDDQHLLAGRTDHARRARSRRTAS